MAFLGLIKDQRSGEGPLSKVVGEYNNTPGTLSVDRGGSVRTQKLLVALKESKASVKDVNLREDIVTPRKNNQGRISFDLATGTAVEYELQDVKRALYYASTFNVNGYGERVFLVFPAKMRQNPGDLNAGFVRVAMNIDQWNRLSGIAMEMSPGQVPAKKEIDPRTYQKYIDGDNNYILPQDVSKTDFQKGLAEYIRKDRGNVQDWTPLFATVYKLETVMFNGKARVLINARTNPARYTAAEREVLANVTEYDLHKVSFDRKNFAKGLMNAAVDRQKDEVRIMFLADEKSAFIYRTDTESYDRMLNWLFQQNAGQNPT
jgi:hypothetical protein